MGWSWVSDNPSPEFIKFCGGWPKPEKDKEKDKVKPPEKTK
jgi:hypothetical protein